MHYLNKIFKSLIFVFFAMQSFFCSALQEKQVTCTLLNNSKSTKKYKCAIFTISRSFWDKSIYDLLSAYQKHKGMSLSHYFKMAKFGTSYLFGNFDPAEAFESFLECSKGQNFQDLKKSCHDIWLSECKKHIYKETINLYKKCKEDGIITIVAEVGMKELYSELLDLYPFDYTFFSELEVKNNKLTGKLVGKPCIGENKFKILTNLIEKKLNCSLSETIFYASSHLDIPFLELVGKPVIINPTDKLKSHAKKRNWQILNFKEFVS